MYGFRAVAKVTDLLTCWKILGISSMAATVTRTGHFTDMRATCAMTMWGGGVSTAATLNNHNDIETAKMFKKESVPQ